MERPIDHDAMGRVLGVDVAERFGEAIEDMSDMADAPAVLCMAFERWHADPTRSLAEHLEGLLDRWDAYQAS